MLVRVAVVYSIPVLGLAPLCAQYAATGQWCRGACVSTRNCWFTAFLGANFGAEQLTLQWDLQRNLGGLAAAACQRTVSLPCFMRWRHAYNYTNSSLALSKIWQSSAEFAERFTISKAEPPVPL
jgi:hypothetical protein